jgi:transcriptional regulator with XRE-family HTH domain
MPSAEAEKMAAEMASILRERREEIGATMNSVASTSYLDRAALLRAERGDRIPSIAFWIDWCDSLGVSLERVIAEARKRVGKRAGKPPSRRPLA